LGGSVNIVKLSGMNNRVCPFFDIASIKLVSSPLLILLIHYTVNNMLVKLAKEANALLNDEPEFDEL